MNCFNGNRFRLVAGVLALLAFTACSPISAELKRDVNSGVTMALLRQDAAGSKGAKVLLGGRIVGTEVKRDQTILEVLQFPLDFQDRPDPSGASGGRFLTVFDKYLDPAIFSEGRLITIVGRVAGARAGHIGEMEYTYPLLAAEGVHLWSAGGEGSPAFTFGIGVGAHIH